MVSGEYAPAYGLRLNGVGHLQVNIKMVNGEHARTLRVLT
jgi:hypothetical protein